MVRPRMGDNIKRTIVRKGNSNYAYQCTSQMIDGKKVSKSKYIGRIDPETGELIPKKVRCTNRPEEHTVPQVHADMGAVSFSGYGDIYFLDMIQKRMHLGEDLMRAFGDSGRTIIAMAMAFTLYPGTYREVADVMSKTSIKDYYGIDEMSDADVVDAICRVGRSYSNMDSFFALRFGYNKDMLIQNFTDIDAGKIPEGELSYLFDHRKGGRPGVITDMRGVPIMYRYGPSSSDLEAIRGICGEAGRLGKKVITFVDISGMDPVRFRSLIDEDSELILPVESLNGDMMDMFSDMDREVSLMHNGSRFLVRGLRQVSSEGRMSCRLTVFNGEDMLMDRDMDVYRCNYLNGHVVLKGQSSEENGDSIQKSTPYGDLILLTSSDVGMESAFRGYEAKKQVEETFEDYRLGDRADTSSQWFFASGYRFINYISLMLRSEIIATLRESNNGGSMTVGNVLNIMGRIAIVKGEDFEVMTQIPLGCMGLFRLFDIDVPEVIGKGVEICDPADLMRPKKTKERYLFYDIDHKPR